MHPEKPKTTVENRDKDFVFSINGRTEKRIRRKRKPVLIIDAPESEVNETTQDVNAHGVSEKDNKSLEK